MYVCVCVPLSLSLFFFVPCSLPSTWIVLEYEVPVFVTDIEVFETAEHGALLEVRAVG